nr:hypothetical protein [uncultured Holophaga sp.]
MTTYQSLDVLTLHPNAREDGATTLSRAVEEFDPGLGRRVLTDPSGVTGRSRSWLWTCKSREEIVALRTWFMARRGKAIPFWAPTWRQDLELQAALDTTSTIATVAHVGYTDRAFPQAARRHLGFYIDGTWVCRQVSAAVAYPSTETEGLTLASALGVAAPLGTLVSYLTLCRLDTDELQLPYTTDSIAEVSFTFVELPQEAP